MLFRHAAHFRNNRQSTLGAQRIIRAIHKIARNKKRQNKVHISELTFPLTPRECNFSNLTNHHERKATSFGLFEQSVSGKIIQASCWPQARQDILLRHSSHSRFYSLVHQQKSISTYPLATKAGERTSYKKSCVLLHK